MSVFTSLGIFILVLLIQVFLQVIPATFTVFYHSALAKTTRKKADDRALSFILGVEFFLALIFTIVFIVTAFIINLIPTEKFLPNLNPLFYFTTAGILAALAAAMFFLYFRREKNSTRTYLSSKISTSLRSRAESVKSRSDCIALGFTTAALELPFTLPLYVLTSVITLSTPNLPNSLFIIIYLIVATLPLFAFRTFFRANHNLAEIQRLRVRSKPLLRLILTLAYLTLAFLTLSKGLQQ